MTGKNIKEGVLNRIFRGGIIIFIGFGFEMIISFAGKILIARYLGSSEYGVISFGVTLLTFSGIVATLGLNTGIARYLPQAETSQSRLNLIFTGFLFTSIFSLIASTIIFYRPNFVSNILSGTNEHSSIFRTFAFVIPVYVSMRYFIGVSQGQNKTLPKVISKNIILPSTRFIVFAIATTYGLGSLVVSRGYFLVYAIPLILLVIMIFSEEILSRNNIMHTELNYDLLAFSLPLLVASAMDTILTNFDTLLIGYLLGPESVGVYSVAYPTAAVLMFVIMSFGHIYLPSVSKLYDDGEKSEIQFIYSIVAKWSFLLTLPVFVVFVVSSDHLLTMVFGHEYSDGELPLVILSIGFLINSMLGPGALTLTAVGQNKRHMYGNILATVVNVLLNVVFIIRLGIIGAAAATTIAYTIQNIYYIYVLRKDTLNKLPIRIKDTITATVIIIISFIPAALARLMELNIYYDVASIFLSFSLYVYLIYVTLTQTNYEQSVLEELRYKVAKFVD
jgi:O-antigen/teichoic acid export membrane protein